MNRFALSIVLVTLASGDALLAEDPRQIAGRTMEQYAAELDDSNRVVRLRAIRSLGAFGTETADLLRQALDHEDAAIRYLAAVQLGDLGGDALSQTKKRLEKLAEDRTSLAVRLAASYALCRAGSTKQHLPLLIKTLEYPERGTVCSCAELIGRIGPDAADATSRLEEVFEQHKWGAQGGDYHIGGAVANALRKVRRDTEKPQN